MNGDFKVVMENAAQVRYQKQLAPIQTTLDSILATIPKRAEDASNVPTVRKGSLDAFDRFKIEVIPKVGNVVANEGTGSNLAIECNRICADFLRTLAVTHHKSDRLLAQTLTILQEAKKHGQNTDILNRVEEDIATVSKLLHDEKLHKNLKPLKSAPYLG